MFATRLPSIFSRLMINNVLVPSRGISVNSHLNVNVTSVLYAEPLKKKKRIDPAVVRAREERKKKKLEKSIRRAEKHARQLKPIIECEVPPTLSKELELRKRERPVMTTEQLEERAQFYKEWNTFKTQEHKETLMLIKNMINAQEKSLAALRKESEQLYQEAIQIDPTFLPYSAKGPTRTPPIEGYEPPDGEYVDITKKFDGET